MEIRVLGSGAWEGIPAPFCDCRVCKTAADKDSKDNRFRPSFQVTNNDKSFIIEASPDIRLQSQKFKLGRVNHFLISHWHFDHMYGLLELDSLGKFQKLKIYCSAHTKEWLDKNFVHIPKEVHVLTSYQSFEIFGVKITCLPLFHMKNRDEGLSLTENTFGYLLESNGKKVAYMADFYEVPEKVFQLIENSDVLITDGTYLFENLIPAKSGYSYLKKDPDHLHNEEILKFISKVNPRLAIIHSISHLTEKKHSELQKLLPKNTNLAFDGMLIRV